MLLFVSRGEALLANRPLDKPALDTWTASCFEALKQTFGEDSSHIYTFRGESRIVFSDGTGRGYDRYREAEEAERLSTRISVLQALLAEIDFQLSLQAPTHETLKERSFWEDLHPTVVSIGKLRYDSNHFADAVESVFKELNNRIKEFVKRKTGKEMDGADLMHTALSPKNPIVTLEDLSSESGRNIQQGYMEIFAGAIIGIRNPKAHANINIDALRARHHLYLASLLFQVFDERI